MSARKRNRLQQDAAGRARQQALAALSRRALGVAEAQALMDQAVAEVARTLDSEYAAVFELLPTGTKMRLRADGGIQVSIHDTGCGIVAENITLIFAHGFTTKKDGHGFGLHSSALAAKEMNALLIASSDGVGQGAVFTLVFPPAIPGQIAA